MLFLTLLLGCGPDSSDPVRDSRKRCLYDKHADSCYRVGKDALSGEMVPDEFGKMIPLTSEDAAIYLARACDQDFQDSCALLPGLTRRGLKVSRVVGALLGPCEARIQSACHALRQVNQEHPGALTPQMLELL